MPEYDFSKLYEQYPSVIAQMPKEFTSHKFILELARMNQTLYIEALYHYRHTRYKDKPAPFMNVHGSLAKALTRFPELIEKISDSVVSEDIFRVSNNCSKWRKVQ